MKVMELLVLLTQVICCLLSMKMSERILKFYCWNHIQSNEKSLFWKEYSLIYKLYILNFTFCL